MSLYLCYKMLLVVDVRNRNRKLKQYGAELYISMVLDQITLIVESDYKSISQHLSNDQRITEKHEMELTRDYNTHIKLLNP